MKTFAKTSFIFLLGILLTGCTVTTKSEDITLGDRAWAEITSGCSEFKNGKLAEAGLFFANAAQLNPDYIPVLEKFNLILNFWISNPNRLEINEFMSLYCSPE
jgi:hypothetical protein